MWVLMWNFRPSESKPEDLTPQAQSCEFNIIRKLKNVPWRDNCAWGVKLPQNVHYEPDL